MPSKRIEDVKNLYQNWAAALTANPEMPLDEWRDMIESWNVLTAEPGGVDYTETVAGGVEAMWAAPKGCTEDRVLLCVHGGGFVTGSMYTHRKLFGHLAKMIGARSLTLNYRRSPEHVHPAQLDDVIDAYTWLLDQGIESGHIVFVGDSSGGGLCITAQLLARERGLAAPAASVLMSPWVDMEVTGESWVSNRGKDVFFTSKEVVLGLASMFLGTTGDRRDPHANPLYGNLAGISPVYIQVGGDEVLLDDSRRLAERARNASVDVTLDIFPEQQHTFQMCVGRAPEADTAVRKIVDWVRPRLGFSEERRSAA